MSDHDQQPPPAPPSPYAFNSGVSPPLAIVIAVLFVALFFVAFFSLYLRRCTAAGTGSHGTSRPAVQSRHVARGIDPSVIEAFPTFIYSEVKDLKFGQETLECAVCLSEFEENETLRMLPKCSHVFHPDCIDTWLTSHTTCPVCRFNLGVGAAESIVAATPADVPDNVTSDHVSITVDEADQNEDLSLIRNQMQNGRTRYRFRRSHTIGHSTSENLGRYTLQLPEHAKKNLNRTISCVPYTAWNGGLVSGGDSRRGSSMGRSFRFVRLDRGCFSDRWVFSRTRPTLSVGGERGGQGEVRAKAKVFLRSVTMPLNCFGAKGDGVERTSALGSARV